MDVENFNEKEIVTDETRFKWKENETSNDLFVELKKSLFSQAITTSAKSNLSIWFFIRIVSYLGFGSRFVVVVVVVGEM